MLIDSHCHVLSTEYDDPNKVIEESLKSGVSKLIINGYDLKTSILAVQLARKYDSVYAAVGIGPQNIDNLPENFIDEINSLAKNKKVVAIGEIGLDYYWTKDTKEKQIYVFKSMLKIAEENKLPVIVHSRESTLDTYNILKEHKVTGIMHCFSGSVKTACDFIKIGFLIGVGGVVTFKNSKEIKEVVKHIDIENIALETDSPYLTPEPHRGKKNEPKYITYVAQKIAELKAISEEEVIEKTGRAVCLKFDL